MLDIYCNENENVACINIEYTISQLSLHGELEHDP